MADVTENSLQVSNGDRYTIVRENGIVTEFIIATPAFGWANSSPDDPQDYYESSLVFDAGTGLLTTDLFGGQSPWTEVTIREDDADRPWERIETRANTDGEVGYKAVIRDNGLNSQEIDSGFGQVATVRADTGDDKIWSVKFGQESDDGAKSVLTIFDDDRMQADLFGADGQQQARQETDIGNVYGWAERSTIWDADGNLDFSVTILDDGRLVTRDYDAGVLRTVLTQDDRDVFDWSERTTTFDADGLRDHVQIIWDDGRIVERDYQAGVLRNVFVEDTADAFEWATIERTYDEMGTLISTERVMDADLPDDSLTDAPVLDPGLQPPNDDFGPLAVGDPDQSWSNLQQSSEDFPFV